MLLHVKYTTFAKINIAKMLVYNTTYTMPVADAREFVIWINQSYIPKILESGILSAPRFMRILSHNDQESECFCLQFSVESTATLHKWYLTQGKQMNDEMLKIFDKRIVGFSTLMEEIDGCGEDNSGH